MTAHALSVAVPSAAVQLWPQLPGSRGSFGRTSNTRPGLARWTGRPGATSPKRRPRERLRSAPAAEAQACLGAHRSIYRPHPWRVGELATAPELSQWPDKLQKFLNSAIASVIESRHSCGMMQPQRRTLEKRLVIGELDRENGYGCRRARELFRSPGKRQPVSLFDIAGRCLIGLALIIVAIAYPKRPRRQHRRTLKL
jgi:hypothetical protein